MRTFLLLLLFFGALLMGCSEDPLLDPAEEALLTTTELSAKAGKAVTKPFKVRSEGTFVISNGADCAPLVQWDLTGTGHATHLGKFDVTLLWCTNYAETNVITGTHVAANGDLLHFYGTAVGEDENGQWTEYAYDGGTGRFENATGYLKMYNTTTFTSPTTGVYSTSGEGTLTY